ncbi:late embryogenesis abundant protein At1g64065-like [Euphorbia lathyris]|uniref:late embryogenesis abundant protein At1g64065-like n=1 Tax=Euphorbia lathyris TaxID=212925 RepID=UPI003313A40D
MEEGRALEESARNFVKAQRKERNARKEEVQENHKNDEVTKKKRTKCIIFAVTFTLFQTLILLLFIFFVLRFNNPKFRITSTTSPSFETFEINSNLTSPSFNFTINTEFGVKNTNFGHFKYETSNVTFQYRGIIVGVVTVDKARVRVRSTRKFYATVVLKMDTTTLLPEDVDRLNTDLRSGKLPFTSSSILNGKIQLMKLIKKKKSGFMDCRMDVDIESRTLQDVICN